MDHRQKREAFPTRSELWQGAILATIAHAIWVFAHPLLAGTRGWDGDNYCLSDGSGSYGAVTFAEEGTVAAFFDLHSTRSPYRLDAGDTYDPAGYFSAAPAAIQQLAQRATLQYLLFDFHGESLPVITAACWSEGERITAGESWSEVIEHGRHLLRTHLQPID